MNDRTSIRAFNAERVYCYDSSVESSSLTFTLFLEYADGQQRLVRLAIDDDVDDDENDNATWVEMQDETLAEIGTPLRAALVGVPASYRIAGTGLAHSKADCYFVARGNRFSRDAFLKSVTSRTNVVLGDTEGYESVVCFLDFLDDSEQLKWLAEPLENS